MNVLIISLVFSLCHVTCAMKKIELVDNMLNITNPRPPLFKDLMGMRDLVRRENSRLETYRVTTDDGYILQLHRLIVKIGDRRKLPGRGMPVLLVPGFVAAADVWLIEGRKRDLPFLLADNGFDVFLGDPRGSYFSRLHETMDKSDPRFWDFSLDEIGMIDIPTLIDGVIQVNGYPKVAFIGHSASPTAYILGMSFRPEYNDKVFASVHMSMATPKKAENLTNAMNRALIQYSKELLKIFESGKIVEWWPRRKSIIKWIYNFCTNKPYIDYCVDIVSNSCGEHRNNLDRTNLGTVLQRWPAGSSTKVIIHLSQIFNKRFQRFDYGPTKNLAMYGSVEAPEAEVEKITSPTIFLYGLNDELTDNEETRKIANRIPGTVVAKSASDPLYNHLDFVFGMNRKEALYYEILQMLIDLLPKDEIF